MAGTIQSTSISSPGFFLGPANIQSVADDEVTDTSQVIDTPSEAVLHPYFGLTQC
jgi:hypothetical protein